MFAIGIGITFVLVSALMLLMFLVTFLEESVKHRKIQWDGLPILFATGFVFILCLFAFVF
jgi:hypothetical protein